MKKAKPLVYDLQDRLINYASMIIEIVRNLPSDRVGNYLDGQLLRSGTSPALHYGEAQAAESRKDFLHKMKVCLKELRETKNCLAIQEKAGFHTNHPALRETEELIAIFVASIKTAERKKEG